MIVVDNQATTALTAPGESQVPAASASTQAIDAGLAKLPITIGEQGLQLRNLDEAWRFAKIVANSGLAPRGLDTPEKVLVAMQFGMEVGLPPLAAIQNVAVINGRPSLYGDVMLGLCMASGKFDQNAFEESVTSNDNGMPLKSRCEVRRLPAGKLKVGEFSLAEAELAGLLSKTDSNWKKYPRRMLQMRARAFALRDAFPDVLKGILSAEEAEDLPPERNVTPAPARPGNLEDLTGRIQPVSEVQASAPVATEATATSSVLPVSSDLPGEDGPELGGDPIDAIKKALLNCKMVSDVTRASQAWLGTNSRLTNPQKMSVNALVQSRIAAIKEEKRK